MQLDRRDVVMEDLDMAAAEKAYRQKLINYGYEKGRKDGRAEIAEARDASCQCMELYTENKRLKAEVEKLRAGIDKYKESYERRYQNEYLALDAKNEELKAEIEILRGETARLRGEETE